MAAAVFTLCSSFRISELNGYCIFREILFLHAQFSPDISGPEIRANVERTNYYATY